MANSVTKSRVMRLSHVRTGQSRCYRSAESGRSSTANSSSAVLIVKDWLKELHRTAKEQRYVTTDPNVQNEYMLALDKLVLDEE